MKRMCMILGMLVVCGVWPSQGVAQSILLDANLSPGYQGLDAVVNVQAGQRIGLEVYGKNIQSVNGFSAQVGYDAGQLQFDGFVAGAVIPGFTGLSTMISSGTMEVGGASVVGAATVSQGRLGVVYFKAMNGFTGNVAVALTQGQFVKGGSATSVTPQAQVVVGISLWGPVVIDADASVGLQAARRVVDVNVGDEIAIEVYGREIAGVSGYAAILEYDQKQLSLLGFEATEIIPGFTGLRLDVDQAVEIGGASVTGTSGVGQGRLGVLRFRVLPGFTGETAIELLGGRLTLGANTNPYTSDLIVTVSGTAGGSVAKTPDFNNNGVVDFPDFLVFASGFGKRLGDAGFVSAIDLNDNGVVDFPDFLLFAQSFGKRVGG